MKIKTITLLLLSTLLVSMNVRGICLASPEDQNEKSVVDLRTYTLQILYEEINDSISEQYGVDWAFSPIKICEINGTNLTVEGTLLKDHTTKKLRINLSKDTSNYKVIKISEIK
ncbi:hypothetical protein [Paenibacillus sp. GCM10028914]|uniref:hypothetical protein n=1 Tax=Paenibacillus sp. GCM10028914 TaxID=3273416 RepID=UPI00360E4347